MTEYRAPLEEITFALQTMAAMETWSSIAGFEDAGEDLIAAILEEAGKLTSDVVAPTNVVGDKEGAKLIDGRVVTPEAFKPMHQAYVEGGWPTLAMNPEYGGQGLPFTLAMAVQEMLTSANMAYSLMPLLSAGTVEALEVHGSEEQQALYLPKLIDGTWSGTMNLTEPSAGSDVGALRTKAEPIGDGRYKITGQKIFITWGDHDLVENTIHMVLARLPDAPEGTKGISMFIVPKYLVNADGSLGAENDLRPVSLEHKMGIHASPTCVMSYGDNGNCIGYLIGEENKGMSNMFTMMNNARVGVGLQGVAIAERAYQQAVAYAMDRVQSAELGSASRSPVAIIKHPDVRRMLMTMRAQTEAIRAIIYRNTWAIDRAHKAENAEEMAAAKGEADLLTPISKAYATDTGCEVASLAVQVHGGMGFIEETGVAQHYRDARIAPIYEGTNGIQALDLVGRKLNMDGGIHWKKLITEMQEFASGMDGELQSVQADLQAGITALSEAAEMLMANGMEKINDTASAATPYLRLFGTVLGGYLLVKQAKHASKSLAEGHNQPILKSKMAIAKFFIEQLLPVATASLGPIKAGAATVMALDEEYFVRR